MFSNNRSMKNHFSEKTAVFFWVLLLLTLATLRCSREKSGYPDYPVQVVPIKNVILSDDFWLPKIEQIQEKTISYAFDKCKKEGRMQNFLVAGGLKEGTYIGKMPFDDTDLYKIIEGASYSLISRPNPKLSAYLDSVIAIIAAGQEKDGYLTTWFTINRQNPPAWWVKPSESRWEHLESSHELYNSGHLFEAAAAHYQATGKRNFLEIAVKNADLLVDNFGTGKLQKPPGHQIAETGLIKLYQIARNKKYLELAKYFLDLRGDSTTHELYGEYSQDHLPVIKQTEPVGHAVRALYMYAGMTDIAVIYNNRNYLAAVQTIWENMFTKKMYITGGLGAKRGGEAFGGEYELPNLTAYNETCAAIASVYWNHRLFLLTGDPKYYDIIERTLYNGLISGLSLDGVHFFYPNPTESDGRYAFNMGSCTRQPWFDCSCCPTNLIRFIPSIPGLIYAVQKDTLFINLYAANHARIMVNDEVVEIIQKTGYPWDGRINIRINPESETAFTLKIRVPGWARHEAVPGELYRYRGAGEKIPSLSVNGMPYPMRLKKGYAVLKREWRRGDELVLDLTMAVKTVIANEEVIEDRNKVAFEYGPFVYCAEAIDNPQITEFAVTSDPVDTTGESEVLSEKIVGIKIGTDNRQLNLIPYYVWSNRGAGKMKVWFPLRN